jgi:uncharacterized protein YkwD
MVAGALDEGGRMGKWCRTAWVATACAALSVASPAMAAEEDDRIVGAINELRASHGLAPLAVSETLTRSAQGHAAWQMRSDWIGHADRIHAPGNWTALGEAIAIHRGHRPRVPATVRRLAASPSHAFLLLSPLFDRAGAAMVHGRLGRRPVTVWVLRLGRR